MEARLKGWRLELHPLLFEGTTARTAPALPAAAPWIGATILAAPAIYTIKEILLNAAEKGVIQSPPSPITMDDGKPVDTATPTTPDTTIPTDEELPKGDLTKTGPDTTSVPATPTTPSTPLTPPTTGPDKGPDKIPPIVGPITGVLTGAAGTWLGSSSTKSVERTEPSLSPDPTRKPKGVPEKPDPDASPEGIRGIERQNESAELLAKAGYDVEYQPKLTPEDLKEIRPTANPDYRIEGKIFDCLATKASRALNIHTKISEKVNKA